MIVSKARQNLPCKICRSYQFAFKCNYNCKYCSSKSSLQTLHAVWCYIFIAFEYEYEYDCKYCSANFPTKSYLHLSIVTSNLLELTPHLNPI